MMRACPEHPEVARVMRDGYNKIHDIALCCDCCGEEIPAGEAFGSYANAVTCIECAREGFAQLSPEEQIEALGLDVCYYGV